MTVLDNYMFRPLLAIFRLSSRELKVLLYNVYNVCACDGEISTFGLCCVIVNYYIQCGGVLCTMGSGIGIEVGVKRRVPLLPFKAQWSLHVPQSGHYTYMHRQFNIHKLYVLPTQCIYVFCVDLRTNSDYFPTQH